MNPSPAPLSLVMFMGSVRQGRMADRVAKLVHNALEKHTKMEVTVIDPLCKDASNELNTQPMHYMQSPDSAPGWMKVMNTTIKDANAFILLSTEYNGLMPPAMTNLLNIFPSLSYRHRPVGIVTYTMGTTGAMRSLNVCRPYASELGMLVVPGFVPIPLVHETLDIKGNCNNRLVNENLQKLVKNLEWYANAIHEYHKTGHTHVD